MFHSCQEKYNIVESSTYTHGWIAEGLDESSETLVCVIAKFDPHNEVTVRKPGVYM